MRLRAGDLFKPALAAIRIAKRAANSRSRNPTQRHFHTPVNIPKRILFVKSGFKATRSASTFTRLKAFLLRDRTRRLLSNCDSGTVRIRLEYSGRRFCYRFIEITSLKASAEIDRM